MTDHAFEQARAHYEAGEFGECREIALRALADRPGDVGLTRLAGKAGLELGLDEAADLLRTVAEASSDDAEAWHDLGDALVYQGRLAEATEAFRRTVQLRPDDAAALVDLGHSAYAAGQTAEAISTLAQAVEHDPSNLAALRGLVGMYRSAERLEEALAAARQIVRARPDDVLAALDVADLSLALDRLDEAVSAFGRLRSIDGDPEHDVYAYHGMIQAEIRRGEWRRALDLAVEATRVDRFGRTTDLLAFTVAQVFGAGDRPAPTRARAGSASTGGLGSRSCSQCAPGSRTAARRRPSTSR